MFSRNLAAILMVILFVHAEDDDEIKLPAKRAGRPPEQCPSTTRKYSYNIHSYNGPVFWPSISRCCGGDWQSPITIYSARTKCGQPFRVYNTPFPAGRVQADLSNSGHGVDVSFTGNYFSRIALNGVPYSRGSDYLLDSLHIHVGNAVGTGSEHRVNDRGYDGEIHLVYFKRQYGSMDKASYFTDGLAVVGVFLQQDRFSPNTELNHLIQNVKRLGNTMNRKIPISLDPRLLVPSNGRFYTYPGSLTTPPCSESVRWMVMTDPILTTQQHLDVLKKLPMDDGTPTYRYTNVRPTISSTDRLVESNFYCVG